MAKKLQGTYDENGNYVIKGGIEKNNIDIEYNEALKDGSNTFVKWLKI